jgi:phage shock protein A
MPDEYEAALGRALSDQETIRKAVETMRQKIGVLERQIAVLNDVIEALLPMISEDRRGQYANRLSPPAARVNRGSTAYDAVVEKIERPPARAWTAPELHRALMDSGIEVEIEQIHNVLNYLYRKGRLVRTTRGTYVPPGMQRAIEQIEEFAS